MTVRLTVHDGELKRFVVPLRSLTGQGDYECIVFASRMEDAGEIAVDKMQEKYLRRQNRHTQWQVIGPIREC